MYYDSVFYLKILLITSFIIKVLTLRSKLLISDMSKNVSIARRLHEYPELSFYSNPHCPYKDSTLSRQNRNPLLNETFIVLPKLGSRTYGVGNMLFVFVAARSLALDFHKTLIRPHQIELDAFSFNLNCNDTYIEQLSNIPMSEKIGGTVHYKEYKLEYNKSYSVYPYMLSYKYFDSPKARTMTYNGLRIHGFAGQQASHIKSYLKDILPKGEPIVCSHVRLGDTMMYRNRDGSHRTGGRRKFPWCANKDYLTFSMKWFDKQLSNRSHYVFFSDTMQTVQSWNLEKYTSNKIYYFNELYTNITSTTTNTPLNEYKFEKTTLSEMAFLLDHCDHLLLTSGTFSYWAGWKSKGLVLYSQQNNNDMAGQHFYPPNFHIVRHCVEDKDKHCSVSPPKDITWNNWKP